MTGKVYTSICLNYSTCGLLLKHSWQKSVYCAVSRSRFITDKCRGMVPGIRDICVWASRTACAIRPRMSHHSKGSSCQVTPEIFNTKAVNSPKSVKGIPRHCFVKISFVFQDITQMCALQETYLPRLVQLLPRIYLKTNIWDYILHVFLGAYFPSLATTCLLHSTFIKCSHLLYLRLSQCISIYTSISLLPIAVNTPVNVSKTPLSNPFPR